MVYLSAIVFSIIHVHLFAVPSLIWKSKGSSVTDSSNSSSSKSTSMSSLYLGGFKSALNKNSISSLDIRLIVNTAPSLKTLFGEKYERRRKKVFSELDFLEEVTVDWQDSPGQKLDKDDVTRVLDRMDAVFDQGLIGVA